MVATVGLVERPDLLPPACLRRASDALMFGRMLWHKCRLLLNTKEGE